MNEIASERTMTVREIAAALGVSYDTANNSVKRLFPEIVRNGVATRLNEAQVAAVSKELKSNNAVTDRLTFEVSSKVKNSTTRLEVLANYKAAAEAVIALLESEKEELRARNEEQAAKIASDAPKVEWYDGVADSTNLVEIGTVGKTLGIGANRFFALLASDGIIYRKEDGRVSYYLPYSEHDAHFRSVPVPFVVKGERLTRHKLMFTQRGAMWAEKRYGGRR